MHFMLPTSIGPYYTRIIVDSGIAIILAVSLNIVNGMTGQFSLGHAAFLGARRLHGWHYHVLRLDDYVEYARQTRRIFGLG